MNNMLGSWAAIFTTITMKTTHYKEGEVGSYVDHLEHMHPPLDCLPWIFLFKKKKTKKHLFYWATTVEFLLHAAKCSPNWYTVSEKGKIRRKIFNILLGEEVGFFFFPLDSNEIFCKKKKKKILLSFFWSVFTRGGKQDS